MSDKPHVYRELNAGLGLEWTATAWLAGPDDVSRTIKLTGPIERRELMADLEAAMNFIRELRNAVQKWDEQAPRLHKVD